VTSRAIALTRPPVALWVEMYLLDHADVVPGVLTLPPVSGLEEPPLHLSAIMIHYSNHWVTLARDPLEGGKGDWLLHNDSRVSRVPTDINEFLKAQRKQHPNMNVAAALYTSCDRKVPPAIEAACNLPFSVSPQVDDGTTLRLALPGIAMGRFTVDIKVCA